MTVLLVCTILGTPQQQGSKRSLGPGRPSIEDNPKLRPWRADAIAALEAAARTQRGTVTPILDPVHVDVSFVYARPKGHYRTGRNAAMLRDSAPLFKASAPDLDKLQRALGDALTQAGIVRDDALIVEWSARKLWGTTPHVELTIRRRHLGGEEAGETLALDDQVAGLLRIAHRRSPASWSARVGELTEQLNDAILYEREARDALAIQTPHLIKAEARVAELTAELDALREALMRAESAIEAAKDDRDKWRRAATAADSLRYSLGCERAALAAKLAEVRALHYEADDDYRRTPTCETCHGKAGVHECGCWSSEDRKMVCGHCDGSGRFESVPYPCPTVAILDRDDESRSRTTDIALPSPLDMPTFDTRMGTPGPISGGFIPPARACGLDRDGGE